MNAAAAAAGLAVSMQMTASPGAMEVTPFSAMALANACELSSSFQPVMSTGVLAVWVASNQSAPSGLLPLDQAATSEITRLGGGGGGLSLSWMVTVALPFEPTS